MPPQRSLPTLLRSRTATVAVWPPSSALRLAVAALQLKLEPVPVHAAVGLPAPAVGLPARVPLRPAAPRSPPESSSPARSPRGSARPTPPSAAPSPASPAPVADLGPAT